MPFNSLTKTCTKHLDWIKLSGASYKEYSMLKSMLIDKDLI